MPPSLKENPLKITDPVTIVIFGATGDLSRKKLLPALFDLWHADVLPAQLRIVGFSRREWTDAQFREFVASHLPADRYSDHKRTERFLSFLTYQRGDFNAKDDYRVLAATLAALDRKLGACSNKLFHLAVPPSLYGTILQHIASAKLTVACPHHPSGRSGWTHVLVEKPFGRDIATAQRLDTQLGALFAENKIFRIDHYLAKEAVQNILTFRFSNALFEHLWNRKHIERVEIVLNEAQDVSHRIEYYDGVGALRDVGQNHLLQLLAVIAMENPLVLEAAAIRQRRLDVLKQLKPIRLSEIGARTVRAQYQGYRSEGGVDPHSETETFFQLTAFVRNKRWRGVPFYLQAGKALNESSVSVKVYLKRALTCFNCEDIKDAPQNVIHFRIQPHEGITLHFWAKQPGLEFRLAEKTFSFNYDDEGTHLSNAYERILFDALRSDQTLFASTQEVQASWKFITPILKSWKRVVLQTYRKGSEGPKSRLFS